ncbi:MAG TPA: SgcJ/EcaC family oxidoreductase [Steroidobacteraceae bacterium]|nr:SgcJ/EcaC family oxidoreductase [Steroidobacteraceae bacterium]
MSFTSDAEAVRTLYHQLMDGWNKGSAVEFAAPFADEFDFIAFDGVRFQRREELVRFHQPLFKTHLRGTRLVGEVTDVRFVSPDVAVMHATGGTIPRGATRPAPERASIQTLVATRRGDAWQLVAFQNTRVRPIGQNAAGTLLWIVTDWMWRGCLPRGDARESRS